MSNEVEEQDVQEEEVEEVDPLTIIAFLQEDLSTAIQALRRIAGIKPANLMVGGPNNKDFGKAYKKAFEKAQKDATKAMKKIAGEEDE